MHPSEKSSCPNCSTINQYQIHRKVKILKAPGKRTVEREELISTIGNIVAYKIHGNSVMIIAQEQNEYVLYKWNNQSTSRKSLFTVNAERSKFDIFGGRYLVTSKFPLSSETITIYDT